MNKYFWYITSVLFGGIFLLSVTYTVPEPSWNQKEVVEDVDTRFIDLQLTDSKLNLVYRNTTESGVLLKTKEAESGLKDSVKNYFQGNNWSEEEVIDESPGSGSYLSAANVSGELMVAYQDASVGTERVILASETVSNWSKETVDNVDGGGVNVGMYTSLTSFNGKPMVLYHSPTQGLKSALKQNGEWKRQVIAEDQGWFTDSTSCGEEVISAYRGRNNQNISLSSYTGEWQTEKTDLETRSSISIDNRNCQPHMMYLSTDEEIIYRNPEGEKTVITDSAYSDTSIDVKETVRASYYDYGEGLYYTEKQGNSWTREKLADSSEAGRYSELEIDPTGNIHVIYTSESNLIHAQKNTGQIRNVRTAVEYIRIALGIIFLTLILQSLRKTQIRESLGLNRNVISKIQNSI